MFKQFVTCVFKVRQGTEIKPQQRHGVHEDARLLALTVKEFGFVVFGLCHWRKCY